MKVLGVKSAGLRGEDKAGVERLPNYENESSQFSTCMWRKNGRGRKNDEIMKNLRDHTNMRGGKVAGEQRSFKNYSNMRGHISVRQANSSEWESYGIMNINCG